MTTTGISYSPIVHAQINARQPVIDTAPYRYKCVPTVQQRLKHIDEWQSDADESVVAGSTASQASGSIATTSKKTSVATAYKARRDSARRASAVHAHVARRQRSTIEQAVLADMRGDVSADSGHAGDTDGDMLADEAKNQMHQSLRTASQGEATASVASSVVGAPPADPSLDSDTSNSDGEQIPDNKHRPCIKLGCVVLQKRSLTWPDFHRKVRFAPPRDLKYTPPASIPVTPLLCVVARSCVQSAEEAEAYRHAVVLLDGLREWIQSKEGAAVIEEEAKLRRKHAVEKAEKQKEEVLFN